MRLPTRLSLIGLVVLAATLVFVAVISHQIILVTGRQSVDRVLRSELDSIGSTLPPLLADTDQPSGQALHRAAQQYLAVHPGTRQHLTTLVIGEDTYTTRTGPEPLLDLIESGELPVGRPGYISTVDTREGAVRVLNAPLVVGDEVIGTAIIASSLREVHDNASDALTAIAVAGLVGLVVGGVVFTITARRAVRPIAQLMAAARGTGSDDLTRRVPEPPHMDEVGQLAGEFNRMLERISSDAAHHQRMLSAVSHELRTPLAVAQGHLEMLEALDAAGRHDPSSDRREREEMTAVIGGELARLGRLTDDLEAILHGDASSSAELGPVYVPDVFDELAQRLGGLDITQVELGKAPPVVVDADDHRLAQALLNLVNNAVTHNPSGTRVSVGASVVDGQLRIEVVDDGPGIDASIRDRVFEPFVTTRADGSTTGRGLGLAIVKSLIEAQHGSVLLDTSPSGTRVTLVLPLSPAEADDDSTGSLDGAT